MQEGSSYMLTAIIGVVAFVVFMAAFGPGFTEAMDNFMETLHR